MDALTAVVAEASLNSLTGNDSQPRSLSDRFRAPR